MKKIKLIPKLFLLVVLLAGCSGNLPLFNDMHKGRADKLERIEITPGDITLKDKSYSMFTATGYYNDGSSSDLTSKCEWSCDDQKVAVISAGGYLQARALSGTANITVRYDSLTSTVKVTVNINLVEIAITPTSSTLTSTNQIYFTATGKTSDGALLDLTKTAAWSVSPFSLAEIDSSGLFMARGTSGMVTVTAKSPDATITSNAAVVQLDLTTLYADAAFTASAGDGTKEKPFPTITQAIARAETIGATRINVAKGTYTESLIIKSNISLYGDYTSSYSGADWTRPSVILPSETKIISSGNTAILYQNGLTAATVIDGFHIEGGNSLLMTTSAAIMCTNASPTIQHNEIFGGRSLLTSVGILNQTSSPIIKNNTIISGGLPGYTGGGYDNYAILCQSFSNPIIGDDTASVFSQTITGPAGSDSTYRIKCESSSNAKIVNNTIETTTASVTAANGILAISSSPQIAGNTIKAASTDNITIRGENTSFRITGNSIEGSIYITSGSMNPVLDGNIIIKGGITVTGSTVGASIRNHVNTDPMDPDYKAQYGKSSRKIIEDGIYFIGSASGTVNNNCIKNIQVSEGSSVTIVDNLIISEDVCPIMMRSNGYVQVMRNYIQLCYSYEYGMTGIYCSDNTNYVIISNNIVYVYNQDASSLGGTIGIQVRINNNAVSISNNIVVIESRGTSPVFGYYFTNNAESSSMRLYNNIILLKGGAGFYGLMNIESNLPYIIQANYFINCSSTFAGTSFCDNATALNSVDASAIGGLYDLNASLVAGPLTLWSDYDDLRSGSTFILNNFHINLSSMLYHSGKDPNDSQWVDLDAGFITPDFTGSSRNVTTGNFSVGPYEYVP